MRIGYNDISFESDYIMQGGSCDESRSLQRGARQLQFN